MRRRKQLSVKESWPRKLRNKDWQKRLKQKESPRKQRQNDWLKKLPKN